MSSQPLHRLVYASRRPQGLRRDPEAEVRDILITSINNNRAVAVTGLLMATGAWFLQALEGPEAAIAATYARILTDSRHTDARVRLDTAAETRAFPRWTMCAPTASDADAAIMGLLVEGPAFDPFACDPAQAVALLGQVAQVHGDLLTHQHAELMGRILYAA